MALSRLTLSFAREEHIDDAGFLGVWGERSAFQGGPSPIQETRFLTRWMLHE
jgi:hypothetical protein